MFSTFQQGPDITFILHSKEGGALAIHEYLTLNTLGSIYLKFPLIIPTLIPTLYQAEAVGILF